MYGLRIERIIPNPTPTIAINVAVFRLIIVPFCDLQTGVHGKALPLNSIDTAFDEKLLPRGTTCGTGGAYTRADEWSNKICRHFWRRRVETAEIQAVVIVTNSPSAKTSGLKG